MTMFQEDWYISVIIHRQTFTQQKSFRAKKTLEYFGTFEICTQNGSQENSHLIELLKTIFPPTARNLGN
jgi:hypothetical protein